MSVTPEPGLRRAAEAGNPAAQADLGILYFSHREYAAAVPWLQKAAERGVAPACNLLGLMHLNGIAVDQQPERAAQYLERAAAQGLKEACYTFANLLFNGIGTAVDEARAWKLLLQAARLGHVPALRALGLLHLLANSQAQADACLRVAARQGDALAQYLLGRQMLARETPREQAEGIYWLRQAAERRVTLAVAGLQKLAALDGGQRMQRLMQAAGPLTAGSAAALKLTVPNLREFQHTLAAEELSVGVLYEIKGVLPPLLCEHFINVAAPALLPSSVADPVTGAIMQNAMRTSSSMYFPLSMCDFITGLTLRRLAALVEREPRHAEPFAILHYQPGQEYKPHRDYFTSQGNREELVDGRGGQRDITIMVYLNEVEAGGETDFPLLGACVAPELGKAVKFLNLDAQGKPNTLTLHAGKPVLRGEKWLLTVWFRQRPFVWGVLQKP
ncbi:MAG: 2OG-Fe(II) oxygenase [Gammaproteobacteria bacterium]